MVRQYDKYNNDSSAFERHPTLVGRIRRRIFELMNDQNDRGDFEESFAHRTSRFVSLSGLLQQRVNNMFLKHTSPIFIEKKIKINTNKLYGNMTFLNDNSEWEAFTQNSS